MDGITDAAEPMSSITVHTCAATAHFTTKQQVPVAVENKCTTAGHTRVAKAPSSRADQSSGVAEVSHTTT